MPKNEQFEPPLPEIVGSAPAMQDVYRLVRLAAPKSAHVLLIGETGTGKEVIAKAVHKLSKRADGPFIRVNCGALHENLLESELFGHIKGAFTGAVENKTGRFEAAHGGTIFLDEINSTSHHLQVKLLRVLQEKEFERVGESRTIRVDAFFLKRYGEVNKCPVPELTPIVLDALKTHDWPGNVRELENTLERLTVFADGGPITSDMLRFGRARPVIRGPRGAPADVPSLINALVRAGMHAPRAEDTTLHKFLVDGVERELIEAVLRESGDNQVKAAQRLGINRNTLHKKREEYRKADDAAEVPADEPPSEAAAG
jgi:DNA-binding NtrC family response regulator